MRPLSRHQDRIAIVAPKKLLLYLHVHSPCIGPGSQLPAATASHNDTRSHTAEASGKSDSLANSAPRSRQHHRPSQFSCEATSSRLQPGGYAADHLRSSRVLSYHQKRRKRLLRYQRSVCRTRTVSPVHHESDRGCNRRKEGGNLDASLKIKAFILQWLKCWRCCQSNANRSPKSVNSGSSGRNLTPLSQSGRSALLEGIAAV